MQGIDIAKLGHRIEFCPMVEFLTGNLNRIMLTVSDLNVGGVKAYQAAGFCEEGVLHQTCYRDGRTMTKS